MLHTPYIEEFKDAADVIDRYSAPEDALDGATVYLAFYGVDGYEGSSWVIFEKGGKLYEVHGSHCSCMGLENQWEPEETSWAAIANYNYKARFDGEGKVDAEVKKLVLEQLGEDYGRR